jgi:hypothetical protein
MAASDARPQPLKNTAFRFYFSMRTGFGELATEIETFSCSISKDGSGLASTVNTPVEIEGDSGICYLDLTASEMNADAVCVKVSAAGTIDMLFVLFPAEASDFTLQQAVISPSAALNNQFSKTTDRNPNPLDCPRLAQKTFSVSIFQLSSTGEKVPVTMTGRTLQVVFELPTGADLIVIENGDILKVDNTVTFTNPVAASTPATGQRQMTGNWSCREVSTNFPWAFGSWQVFDVAIKD